MNKWIIINELKSGFRNRHFPCPENPQTFDQTVMQKEEAEEMSGTLFTWSKFMEQQL